MAGKTGAASVPVIDPPKNTEAAKTAPVIRTYHFPGQTSHRRKHGASDTALPMVWLSRLTAGCGRLSMGRKAATS